MRNRFRRPLLPVLVLALVACAGTLETRSDPGDEAFVKALGNAMDPGEGQAGLDFMVGEFNVKIRVWLDPSHPPIESRAIAINTWVLGQRFVRSMLSGFVMDEPFQGISYVGYDNVLKQYQATFMDSGGTGMAWFSGSIDPTNESAHMSATIPDPVTGEPTKVELKLEIAANGDHVTEVWEEGPTGEPARIMELHYIRSNP